MRPHQTQTTPRRGRALLAAGLAVTSLWAGAATYGLVFHDDLMAGLLARQAAIQAGYEERLATLREAVEQGQRDRAALREGLERRLAAALDRQAELERRHAVVTRLPDPDPRPAATPAPEPFGLRGVEDAAARRAERAATERLTGLETALDAVQAAQARALGRVAAGAARRMERLRGVIRGAGLDPARFEGPAPAAMGGPLVPLSAPASGDAFAEALETAQRAVDEAERMGRLAGSLPLRRPILGPSSVSSTFGTRLDPFTRGLALHTGLDLKAEFGEAARATAPGRVTLAEYTGGYGNMVEIDHGHGLATRFAHLARIAVAPGQVVTAGQMVGQVGSTGRSTGAHLHYETRIDGEPVDPERFLGAGRRLAADLP